MNMLEGIYLRNVMNKLVLKGIYLRKVMNKLVLKGIYLRNELKVYHGEGSVVA
jgi:hypothetical protein